MSLLHSWFIGEALIAIGRNLDKAECFSHAELAKWRPEVAERSTIPLRALKHLHLSGFVTPIQRPTNKPWLGNGVHYYAITSDGKEAAIAAAAEATRLARSKGALKMSEVTRGSSVFAARLWSMFRLRQQLTALDAAELLTDAGGDIEAAKVRAATYLRTWAKAFPAEIQVSAQRFDGFKRYVLLKDLGPSVPAVGIHARFKKGAAA